MRSHIGNQFAVSTPSGVTAPVGVAVFTDYSVWLTEPKEHTSGYVQVFAAVSRDIQGALRRWTLEWIQANPAVLNKQTTAKALLVYTATNPFIAKSGRSFTYEILESDDIHRAFSSAAFNLERILGTIDRSTLRRSLAEHYLPYLSDYIIQSVMENRQAFYHLLNSEFLIMRSVLHFAAHDIESLDMPSAIRVLRASLSRQLSRLSEAFDFSERADELIRIATNALVTSRPLKPVSIALKA